MRSRAPTSMVKLGLCFLHVVPVSSMKQRAHNAYRCCLERMYFSKRFYITHWSGSSREDAATIAIRCAVSNFSKKIYNSIGAHRTGRVGGSGGVWTVSAREGREAPMYATVTRRIGFAAVGYVVDRQTSSRARNASTPRQSFSLPGCSRVGAEALRIWCG